MKKALCGIFIALTVLIAAVLIFTTVNSRTLKNNIKYEDIDIFVPSGMANEYEDLVPFTFDDHRIWKYKLSGEEAQKMNEDIEIGLWREFYNRELAEDGYFFPDGYFKKRLI